MSTHVATSLKSGSTLFEFDTGRPKDGLRVLAICGVTCDAKDIVAHSPSCSWCQRKVDDAEAQAEQARLDRIARSRR